jgi:hypothetical protein
MATLDQVECLADFLDYLEALEKVDVQINHKTKDIVVTIKDMDEQWFYEIAKDK